VLVALYEIGDGLNYFYTALDFRERIGGERKIQEYCHRIALQGGRKAAEILGTDLMDERDEFTASMVRLESFISHTKAEPIIGQYSSTLPNPAAS
jgi:hypothetical protein